MDEKGPGLIVQRFRAVCCDFDGLCAGGIYARGSRSRWYSSLRSSVLRTRIQSPRPGRAWCLASRSAARLRHSYQTKKGQSDTGCPFFVYRGSFIDARVFLDLNAPPIDQPSDRLYRATMNITAHCLDKEGLAELFRELFDGRRSILQRKG